VIRHDLIAAAIALLVATAAGSVLILVVGESPGAVYTLLLSKTWGSAYGIGQVLYRATPLIFTGLAVALAFRAGLFNIGAEGQMIAGGLAAGVFAASIPAALPAPIAVASSLAVAAAAGAAIGALPGWLKARFGAHEVINTIMLNFIVASVALWLGNQWFFAPGTTHTAAITGAAELPALGLGPSLANASFLVALAAAGGVWYLLARTRRGYELRAVGLSPGAAETGGISIGRTWIGAMALSGALAGLVAANFVLGDKHYFEIGVGRGVGFVGIAVALLGRNHPVGVVLAALFFGTLEHGGFVVSSVVPKEVVGILTAVVILAVVASSAEVRRLALRAAGGESR
jgi:simple sugar transport system permease protein